MDALRGRKSEDNQKNQIIAIMAHIRQEDKHMEIVWLREGKSEYHIVWYSNSALETCITDPSLPIKRMTMTRRKFFTQFRGCVRRKPDTFGMAIPENLWGYDGPKTKLPRLFIKP